MNFARERAFLLSMPRLVHQDVGEASQADLGLVKIVGSSVHHGRQVLHVSPFGDPSSLLNVRLDASHSDVPTFCTVWLGAAQDGSDFPRVFLSLPSNYRLSGRLGAWAVVRPIQS